MERTPHPPPVPKKLVELRSATVAYLAMVHDVHQWTLTAADVDQLVAEGRKVKDAVAFAGLLEWLRDHLWDAMQSQPMGTAAAIDAVLAEMLDR